MTDSLIQSYCKLTERMLAGEFSVNFPLDGNSDLDRLGQRLNELGAFLDEECKKHTATRHILSKINAGLMLEEVLQFSYKELKTMIPFNRIGLALIEDEGASLKARWAFSEAGDVRLRPGYVAALAGSSLERVLATREPRIINDLEQYLRDHPQSEPTRLVVEEGVRSSLTCPLIANDKPVGFLFFSSFSPNTYRDVEVNFFLQIASEVAIIVEKSRMYDDMLKLNEMKSKILGVVAHDLRGPVAIINGYLDILKSESLGPVPESQAKVLSKVSAVVDRMVVLINDLLDMSAIESGRLDLAINETSLDTFLTSVATEHALLAGTKKIRIGTDLHCPSIITRFDPTRIEQVLGNLISNAIKFSKPETTVTIRSSVKAEFAQISIIDQGLGIPAEEMGNLFSYFGRTSTRPTGGEKTTGLGLIICKRIIEAHGGTIQAESSPGQGSIFTIALPI